MEELRAYFRKMIVAVKENEELKAIIQAKNDCIADQMEEIDKLRSDIFVRDQFSKEKDKYIQTLLTDGDKLRTENSNLLRNKFDQEAHDFVGKGIPVKYTPEELAKFDHEDRISEIKRICISLMQSSKTYVPGGLNWKYFANVIKDAQTFQASLRDIVK